MGRGPRALARTALAAVRVPLSVTGSDRLPSGGGVLVLNHSSYMDAVIVAAALPGEPTYVAKKEPPAESLPARCCGDSGSSSSSATM